jgi:very-short-patch-repair endonuclease
VIPPLKGARGMLSIEYMSKNIIIPYNPKLRSLARQLRNNSTLSEVLLWKNIKGKSFDYEFHRQVPLFDFIVDFYCHELNLAIEIDGNTHDYNYDHDEYRQKTLENIGIKFIRFSDNEVKRNINDVLRALEYKIREIEKDKKLNDND